MTERLNAAEERRLTIYDQLADMENQFALALGGLVPSDRFVRVCRTQLRLTPELVEKCKPLSVLGAFMKAAQLGLEPGINCSLLPFGEEAQFIPGRDGVVELMYRSGKVRDVNVEVVYEGDEFDWQRGTDAYIRHRPAGLTIDPKKITHAYAIVRTTMGGTIFDVMNREELEAIKARSPSVQKKKHTPWNTDYAMMCKKTVVIRIARVCPSSTQLREAIRLDDLASIGKSQGLEHAIDVTAQSTRVDVPKPPAEKRGNGPRPASQEDLRAAAEAATRGGGKGSVPNDGGARRASSPPEREPGAAPPPTRPQVEADSEGGSSRPPDGPHTPPPPTDADAPGVFF